MMKQMNNAVRFAAGVSGRGADEPGSARLAAAIEGAHTPGPWTNLGSQVWANDHEQHIASCATTTGSIIRDTANARLIAAAPDLLAQLEAAHAYLMAHVPPGGVRKNFHSLVEHACLCKDIHAAIRKATGR